MIEQPIPSTRIQRHLSEIAPDSLDIFLLSDGSIRGAILHGSRMVNQMRSNHKLGILETYVLGQAYLAAGLLSSSVKGRDRISFSIECAGPLKGLSVESNANAQVRGYLSQTPIPLEKELESFDLSPLFGPGFLKVSKILEGAKAPFSGQIMLRSGNIAEDLAWYFLESEQTKSFFALSLHVDKGGSILGAGGLFLQEMPGADEALLSSIQEKALELPSIGTAFSQGAEGKDIISQGFADYSPQIIGNKKPRFFCGCSRERFTAFLAGMQGSQQEEILKDGEFPLRLECHNCSSVYEFSRVECEELFSN